MCPGDNRVGKGLLIGLCLGGVGGLAVAALYRSKKTAALPVVSAQDYVTGYLVGVRSRYNPTEPQPPGIRDPHVFAMGQLDGKSATPPAYNDPQAVQAWNQALLRPAMWERDALSAAENIKPARTQ